MTSREKVALPSPVSRSRSSSRRRMLKGGLIAGVALPFAPSRWSAPVVESVLLPAHADTSASQVNCPSAPDPITLTCEPTGSTYYNYSVTPPPTGCSLPDVTFINQTTTLSDDPSICFAIYADAVPGLTTHISVRVKQYPSLVGLGSTATVCSDANWDTSPAETSLTCDGHPYQVTLYFTAGSLNVNFTVT